MILLADCSQFKELLSRLQNDYIKGNDNYLINMAEAQNIMNHYIRYINQRQYFNYSENMYFTQ